MLAWCVGKLTYELLLEAKSELSCSASPAIRDIEMSNRDVMGKSSKLRENT
jgi:hypothetical protein